MNNRKLKSIEPAAIFATGEQFYQAAHHLTRATHQNAGNFGLPAMVSSAFALELFFKCLLVEEGSSPMFEHHLERLFNALDMAVQTAIRAAFIPHLDEAGQEIAASAKRHDKPVPLVTFDLLLRISAEAFENLRYVYEGLPFLTGWVGSGILKATREVIVARHPDWPRLVIDLDVATRA